MPVVDHLEPLLREKLEAIPPTLIAIDSPSGFARNTFGHGRRTEKARAPFGFAGAHQIYAQMTPSLDIGKPHGGTRWSWIMFGMATFAVVGGRLPNKDRESGWRDYLGGGPNGSEPLEAFPSATIQFLRQARNAAANNAVRCLLRGMVGDQVDRPRKLIESALEYGPKALDGDDRAAALITALSTLGTVFPGAFAAVALDDQKVRKHAPAKIGREGQITLVGSSERERSTAY